ncbi:hypothetical protein MKEN_00148600 [Mycena kentingensis (nom. inval.)]|nr:hypothetical protein MKEN_00148600 [Mycena kentingensis (nom. inval.)]
MHAPTDDSKYPDSYPYGMTPPRYGTRQPGKKGKAPCYVLAWKLLLSDIAPGPSGVGSAFSGLGDDFVTAWADNVRASPAKTVFMEPLAIPFVGGLNDFNIYYTVAANSGADLSLLTEEDMEYARKALPKLRKRAKLEGSVEDQLAWYRRRKL